MKYLECGDILSHETGGSFMVVYSDDKKFTIKCIILPTDKFGSATIKIGDEFTYHPQSTQSYGIQTLEKLLKRWIGYVHIKSGSKAAEVLFGDNK